MEIDGYHIEECKHSQNNVLQYNIGRHFKVAINSKDIIITKNNSIIKRQSSSITISEFMNILRELVNASRILDDKID